MYWCSSTSPRIIVVRLEKAIIVVCKYLPNFSWGANHGWFRFQESFKVEEMQNNFLLAFLKNPIPNGFWWGAHHLWEILSSFLLLRILKPSIESISSISFSVVLPLTTQNVWNWISKVAQNQTFVGNGDEDCKPPGLHPFQGFWFTKIPYARGWIGKGSRPW